jgi:AcrR family transcriptional regulator
VTETAPDIDLTRQRLVAAAAEVFAERGYEGAGVQEIARRAGLTTGAIYSRYSGKAELLAEAIHGEASPQLEALFATAEGGGISASELIRRVGGGLVQRRPDGDRLLLLEAFVAARRDPDLADAMRSHLEGSRDAFARLVEIGKRKGDLDPALDTDSVVHFCQAVGLGFLLYEAIDASGPDPDGWIHLIDRLVEALERS